MTDQHEFTLLVVKAAIGEVLSAERRLLAVLESRYRKGDQVLVKTDRYEYEATVVSVHKDLKICVQSNYSKCKKKHRYENVFSRSS